ncbi:hypothetical protein ACN47E_006126 [Coniothyrium glycines]
MITGVSLVLVLLLAVFGQGAPTILFPDPDPSNHGFKVAVTHFPLTDAARKDPYVTSSDRNIMASIFMPVARAACTNECKNAYAPPQTSRIADEQFLLNVTSSVFDNMGYNICCGTATNIDAASLPVVVLEPHTDTSRLMYGNLARYIASNGVVVVLLDHPGDTSIVEFTGSDHSLPTVYNSGKTQLSNYSPLTAWNTTIQNAVDIRIADITFALSQLSSLPLLHYQFPTLKFSTPLNTTTYGIVGHGLGGTVATALSFTAPSIRFSVSLSGTPPLLSSPPAHTAPLYFLGRENANRTADIHWPTTWRFLRGPATELDIADSEIMDSTDLPIVLELAHNEGKMPHLVGRGLGTNGAWANHAVTCVVEGIVKKEMFGDGKALAGCVRTGPMGVVPWLGNAV